MKLSTLKPRIPALLDSSRISAPVQAQRLRGRAAVDRRENWLRRHPLCVKCKQEGRVTVGHEVDHIVPLWRGGLDDYETNGQTLCDQHHLSKSAKESSERARGG
jgi:5-methylcytosine-specific restriction protein A